MSSSTDAGKQQLGTRPAWDAISNSLTDLPVVDLASLSTQGLNSTAYSHPVPQCGDIANTVAPLPAKRCEAAT